MKIEDIIRELLEGGTSKFDSFASTTVETLVDYIDNEEVNFGNIESIPQHDKYRCPDKLKFINQLSESHKIIWLDPIQVLKSVENDHELKIRKTRYVKVCRALSKGEIDFPEVYLVNGKIELSNGRHRTCAIWSNCGNFDKLPFIIDKDYYDIKLDLGPLDNFDLKTNTLILK